MKAGIREFKMGGQACVAFWCPGCKAIHWVPIDGSRGWKWDSASQTLEPSVRHFHTKKDGTEQTTCHYFVRQGVIDLLADSTGHQVRGQIPLDEAPPENYGGREHFGWA